MALSFFWRAEGTTLDATHDFANGSGTVTLNSAASISGTAALAGSNGLLCNGVSHQGRIYSSTAIFDTSVGAIGLLFRATAWAGGTSVVTVGTGGANQYGFKVQGSSGSGKLTFCAGEPEGSAVEAITTVGNLAQCVTYGFIGRLNHVANTVRVEVYSSPTS